MTGPLSVRGGVYDLSTKTNNKNNAPQKEAGGKTR